MMRHMLMRIGARQRAHLTSPSSRVAAIVRLATTDASAPTTTPETATAMKTAPPVLDRRFTKHKSGRVLDESHRLKLIGVSSPDADPVVALQNAISLGSLSAATRALEACVERKRHDDVDIGRLVSIKELVHRSENAATAVSENVRDLAARNVAAVDAIIAATNREKQGARMSGLEGLRASLAIRSHRVNGHRMKSLVVARDAVQQLPFVKKSPEHVLNEVISSLNYVVSTRIDATLDIIKRSRDAGAKWKLHTHTALDLLGSLVKQGRAEVALQFLRDENKLISGVSNSMIGLVCRGLAEKGADVQQVQKAIDELNAKYNLKMSSNQYAALICAVARNSKDTAESVKLFREMRSKGIEALPSVFVDLIKAHGAKGDVSGVISFYHKNDSVPFFRRTPNMALAVVNAFIINANPVQALFYLREAFSTMKYSLLERDAEYVALAVWASTLDVEALNKELERSRFTAGQWRAGLVSTLARAMVGLADGRCSYPAITNPVASLPSKEKLLDAASGILKALTAKPSIFGEIAGVQIERRIAFANLELAMAKDDIAAVHKAYRDMVALQLKFHHGPVSKFAIKHGDGDLARMFYSSSKELGMEIDVEVVDALITCCKGGEKIVDGFATAEELVTRWVQEGGVMRDVGSRGPTEDLVTKLGLKTVVDELV